jgi:hypothetical protein
MGCHVDLHGTANKNIYLQLENNGRQKENFSRVL